ncbi:Histidinol-phosphate aminotransferase [Poriferisphaera corsica]|uniref:Histidinol-phosphate aminotransferase n=1 Tax=Poriferisphaera corsica TaxID=2528020 RepID=A0A517YTW7_9BACT|nr:histidinol-phosphate transaminase [Poriferisphaera corsica]QDU33671.1 Histidinol-phosphate aminotransferase [Poriferisphaera corsica]
MSYERDNIRRLSAYTPGEQPKAADIIKLNTNENPYPPVKSIMDALSSIQGEHLRKYPPATAIEFREATAKVHSVQPDQVIATNGSDELLRLAITCYCEPNSDSKKKGALGLTDPTYSLYNVLADIHDALIVSIDLDDQYQMPTDLAEQWNRAGCTLAMIVNPHAPSGRVYEIDQLKMIATAFNGILIIDEAYADFADFNALDLVRENSGLNNVLISRTFSKGYSLAGLRFGYGIAPASIIDTLNKAKDSYNTDFISQKLATAAILAHDDVAKTWDLVKSERSRVENKLIGMGYHVFPSQTNFLLAIPPKDAPQAEAIYRQLAEQHIYIRHFSMANMRDKIRISIGTPEQNDTLLQAMKELK